MFYNYQALSIIDNIRHRQSAEGLIKIFESEFARRSAIFSHLKISYNRSVVLIRLII